MSMTRLDLFFPEIKTDLEDIYNELMMLDPLFNPEDLLHQSFALEIWLTRELLKLRKSNGTGK